MLQKLNVSLRPRNPWEAIDLGVALVRNGWHPVYAAWCTVYVPLAIVLMLVFGAWASLAIWWIKPALDRIVLHVVASSVFGAAPALATTLKALPGVMRHGLFSSLTIYRFDLARSFNLPVWQLERQSGRAARLRGKQLHKRTRSYAVWLTAVFSNFEWLVMLSLIGLFDMLIPVAGRQEYSFFALLRNGLTDLPNELGFIYCSAYLIAVAVLEPFYVACGFALYLNRRALLEGWDIEMQMRRLTETRRTFGRAALILALVWGALSIPTPEACADDLSAGQIAREIKNAPEFRDYVDKEFLDYRGDWNIDHNNGEARKPPRWLQSVGLFLAQFSRWIMWVVLAFGVTAMAYYLSRHLSLRGLRPAHAAPPQTLFGMDVRPESLPTDVAASALALARAGDVASALSLLYRGALATLIQRNGVEFSRGDTEGECLHRARSKVGTDAGIFLATLVASWQRVAYAQLPLERPQVEQLCSEWRTHFSRSA